MSFQRQNNSERLLHLWAEVNALPVEGGAPPTAVVVGCGALHVMWEDLAEVRTLAVAPYAKATRQNIIPTYSKRATTRVRSYKWYS